MGNPAARVTDPHSCPLSDGPKRHKGGPILPPGKPTVLIGGLPAATVTDLCACRSVPDIIMQGARTVLINGLPAARQYDKTVHGGMITMGCPSVLIGGPVYEDLSLLQYKPEEEESLVELGLSMLLDFTPVVGSLKGFGELFWGHDLVTGEKLSIFERLIGWVPIFGKLGRVVKNGKKAGKILGFIRKSENVVDKIVVKNSVKPALKKSPSQLAREAQGHATYPGVDRWRDVRVRKGKIVYKGEGNSGFYTTERAMKNSRGEKVQLWNDLQVAPHPEKGYRKKVEIYEVLEDSPAAFAKTKANPIHGKGDAQQIYMKDAKMRKIGEIDLK